MNGFNERTIINSTRKEHKCICCSNIISTGSKTIRNKGFLYDVWHNEYLHPECEKAREKYSGIFLDGVREGSIRELVDYFGDEVHEDEAVQKYILGEGVR